MACTLAAMDKWNNLEETLDFSGFMEHLAKSGQPSLEQ